MKQIRVGQFVEAAGIEMPIVFYEGNMPDLDKVYPVYREGARMNVPVPLDWRVFYFEIKIGDVDGEGREQPYISANVLPPQEEIDAELDAQYNEEILAEVEKEMKGEE